MRTYFGILMVAFCLVFGRAWAGEASTSAFKQGDRIVGLKLALGSVAGSNVGFVLSGEYGFKDNWLDIEGLPNGLGFGGSFGYSAFSEFIFPWGNYSYRNYLFLGSVFWHVDVFRQKPIDTYLRANLGLNVDVSSKPAPEAPGVESTYGGFQFGFAIGGRYYFHRQWAGVVELGFGTGNVRLGVDYRF